jgi:hypothetical protein
MVNDHRDDPPYEKKGKGIPIMGIKPIVIPIFTKK